MNATQVRHGSVRVIERLGFGLLVQITSQTKKGAVAGKYTIERDGSGYQVSSIPETGIEGSPEVRRVTLDGHCDCPDHTYRGSVCKHIRSVTALSESGRI